LSGTKGNIIPKRISTDDLIRELHATLVEAGRCLRYWRVFNNPSTPPDWELKLGTYRVFFRTTRSAFLTTAIIDLYKLYDPTRPAMNLGELQSRAAGKHPGDANVSKAAALIASASSLWKRIQVLRNKVFAHRDTRNDVDYWFRLAAVSPDALFKLHDVSEEVLNLLSYAHDRSSYVSAKLREPSDLQQMLGDLASMRLPPIKPMQRSRGKRD